MKINVHRSSSWLGRYVGGASQVQNTTSTEGPWDRVCEAWSRNPKDTGVADMYFHEKLL